MIKALSKLIMREATHEEFFEKAHLAGYKAVELCLLKSGNALTLDNAEHTIPIILKLSKEYDLPVISLTLNHCTGNLLFSGEMQERSISETVRGLEIAKLLGAKVALHTLGDLHEDVCYDEAYQNAVNSLKAISPHARRLGVTLAVEFVWNGFAFSPLEMKRLLDDVGDEFVGFYFDPGNMAVFHYPQHWARILGRQIKMVHLKDWRGGALDGKWPALFMGDVNFPKVMLELKKAGYKDALISEVELSEATLSETSEAIDKIIDIYNLAVTV
jgi:hexulose-6-phosphate isomerase